ncbi:MAG: hypothetical protein HC897_04620 [Thermoanaerobaculia bacterium]|nr:hypothetical protein [Thermoanaerobaculia bacterium]
MIRSACKTSLVAIVLLSLPGCQSRPIRVCPDEHESMLSDGTVQEHQFSPVSDPSAGGILQGKPPAGTERPTKLLLLLDYSGSMFAGYGKTPPPGCNSCAAGSSGSRRYFFGQPEFQDLLARWLDGATPAGSNQLLEILLFNERVWRLGERGVEPYSSPAQLSFSRPIGTADTAQIAAWLREIPASPYDVDPKAPGATESKPALQTVLAAIDDEAIVWLVTDNIVDRGGPNASAEDARRNLEFYNYLRSEPRLQMVAAYPVLKPEPCSWMCGSALFAYGMYVSRYERPPSTEFHRLGGTTPTGGGPEARGLLWNPVLSELAAAHSGKAAALEDIAIAGVPLRLKPIDAEVLSFDFALQRGEQALACKPGAEFDDPLECAIEATIRNTLRHQTVESATVVFTNRAMLPRKPKASQRLRWASAICADQMQPTGWRLKGGPTHAPEEPIKLGPLAPLEEVTVEYAFDLPAVGVDTSVGPHIFDVAFTDRILLDGRVSAEIRDIRTSLFLDASKLEDVYGAADLPAIFRGQQQARIVEVYPAGAVVANNGQTLGLLVLLGGGSLLLLVGLVVMRFQKLYLTVMVDGVEHAKIGMPRLSYHTLTLEGSPKAALVRGWGASYRVRALGGYRLGKDGSTWLLRTPEGGEEIRLDIHRGWGVRAHRASAAHDDGW